MITPALILPLLLASAGPAALPAAPTEPFSEVRYGHRIDDPYRWMEDPANAERLQAWVTQAGEATQARLAALPERARFLAMLEEATRAGTSYGQVQAAGGRLFFLRRDPGAPVPKLVVREADGQDRVLLDPAGGEGATRAIASYAPSPDGRTVAVMVGEGGGEIGRFRLIDAATGAERLVLAGSTFGDFELNWLAPDLVTYTRITAAEGADPLLDMQATLVTLGEAGAREQAVLGSSLAGGPPFAPEEFPIVMGDASETWVLGLGVGARADGRVMVAPLASLREGKPAWRELAGYADQVLGGALRGDDYYYLSTREAPNGALYRRRLGPEAIGAPELVLPAGERILARLVASQDGLYVAATRDGASELLFLGDGQDTPTEVALPFESDLIDLRRAGRDGAVLIGLRGWAEAPRFYRVTAGTLAPLGLESANWAPTAVFTTQRAEATSADGTRVPMVVLRKPGEAGRPVPTIVEGYGSYGVLTISPFSSPFFAPWVERGGAFVFCGTRGGGERGRAWHEGGRAANKPRAQEDLVACARQAQAMGVASPATTVVTGTSAGGLLAPGAAMRDAALFTGLIPRVAVLNATRLEFAPNGPNQFAEMGDPRTQAGFEALLAQDAYLMLATAGDLPDTLVTVGMNDSRVAPWMSAKFAARALARFGERRDVLLRVDAAQGHGIGSSRDSQVAEFADTFAWAWAQASEAPAE